MSQSVSKPAKKSLLIHLGDHKTGSTSIQAALKRGTWISEGGPSLAYPTEPSRLHHYLPAASLHAKNQRAFRDRRWRALAQRVRDAEADLVVLSAEEFENVPPKALKKALEEFLPEFAEDARLITYLRPHAERLVSSFQEQSKLGSHMGTMTDFHHKALRQKQLLYAPRVARWKAVFGDRYQVRPMIRSRLKDGDAVLDFLDWALDGAPVRLETQGGWNVSVTLEDLALLRAIHRAGPFPPAAARRLAGALNSTEGGKRTKIALHRALVAEIQKAYAEDAAKLDARYFDGQPMTEALTSAEEKAVDEPQSIAPRDHFKPAELRRIRAFAKFSRALLSRAKLPSEIVSGDDEDQSSDDAADRP